MTAFDDSRERFRSMVEGLVSDVASTNGHADDPDIPSERPHSGATKSEKCTDVGNARRLIRYHGDDLHYSKGFGWMVYDGIRWSADRTGEVCRRAKATARSIYGEAQGVSDSKLREALAKHAIHTEAEPRIRAMMTLAQSEIPVCTTEDQFDVDLFLLNTPNGTLDLRTRTLLPHHRKDLITKCTNVPYDPAARSPNFQAFLNKIFRENERLIRYVQRAVGYSLTGDMSEQVFFIPWGSGANGKSTLTEVVAWMMGDYADCAMSETFLSKRPRGGPTNDLAALCGMRYVHATEVDTGRHLSESTIKRITGGDAIKARFLFRELFTFHPVFKLWLSTNHLPVIGGSDHAIWRRVHLIPFTVEIPPAERDKHLKEKLKAEGAGILAWAVEGYRAWREGGLDAPPEVSHATADYRKDMDVLGPFFEQVCVLEDGASVRATALYEAYRAWCQEAGEKEMAQRALALALKDRGYQSKHTNTGNVWQGLRLRDITDVPTPADPCDEVDLRVV